VSTFVTPIATGTTLEKIAHSANAAALRYAGDPLMWLGVPAGTAISAFASGMLAVPVSGTSGGLPGNAADAWTLFQFSPFPQRDPAAFKAISAGLPIQLVIVAGTLAPTATDEFLAAGAPLVTAPAGTGSTAFMAFAFQDRICRDALSQVEAIAASNACDSNWTAFETAIAALPGMRNVRILDERGFPMFWAAPDKTKSVAVSVAIDTGAPATVTLQNANDGDTGIALPAASSATVGAPAIPHAIVASDDDHGAFEGTLALAAGKRFVQLMDPAQWLVTPEPGVLVKRWQPNSNMEMILEGIPYFAKLVPDIKSAMTSTSANAGAVEFSGWDFVRGSLYDTTVDWELVPGDPSSTIFNLINTLHQNNGNPGLLVNQFLQFNSPQLNDFPQLAPILMALYASLSPLQALIGLQTDPAGYIVGFLAVGALVILLRQPIAIDAIKSIVETSKPLVDDLAAIGPTIAIFTPYPAAFSDNPIASNPPAILGNRLTDISHLGVYHQKYVVIQPSGPAPQPAPFAYLGGIDIDPNRLDTSMHRARDPWHDVQARITGPAVADVARSYAERATFHSAPVHIPTPADGSLANAGSHLVQIARTYFVPGDTSSTPPLPFAPNGETTPRRSILAAFAQARDYIYIEDQYFTPPDEYVEALLAAANNGVRALAIVMPYQADVPYGGKRRDDVLTALGNAWGDRLFAYAAVRRFRHEMPGLTTNLGRTRLAADMGQGAVGATLAPLAHVPLPPFWAFVGNELILFLDANGAPAGINQTYDVVRVPGQTTWGSDLYDHKAGDPVLAVQIPSIYVHAKVTIVDDAFVAVGSVNVNRRSMFHDGEIHSLTIPQHLRGDPRNPARVLRSQLLGDHLGLGPEMGQSLFADPISAFQLFPARTWYQGSHAVPLGYAPSRPLPFFGSAPPSVPLGTGDSIGSFILGVTIPTLQEAAMHDVWPLLVDPTTKLDPSAVAQPPSIGPDYP
jgi:phosphatidylserine/phosphatidylglycerophosphate/cardiolipin synthase-like enzyme